MNLNHEEHKEKFEEMALWFLRELRALRCDPPEADCMKCK